MSWLSNMATHMDNMYAGSEDKIQSKRLQIITCASIAILFATCISVGTIWITKEQSNVSITVGPKPVIANVMESTTTTTTLITTTTISKFPEICMSYKIDDGICQLENARVECDFDGNDCCQFGKFLNESSIGDGICQLQLDQPNCSYDGNDCRTKSTLMSKYPDCKYLEGLMSGIGDGYCDDVYNSKQCGFDEGDCCLHESMLKKEFCSTCACFSEDEQNEGKICVVLVDSIKVFGNF